MIRKRKIFSPLVFCAFAVLSVSAVAAECGIDYQMIVNMQRPERISYNVWDNIYGHQDYEERFVSGLGEESGGVIVVGEKYKSDQEFVDLVLAQINRRGRVEWQQIHAIPALVHVQKIVRLANHFAVMGETKDKQKESKQIWVGYFDSKGALVTQGTINREGLSLEGADLSADSTGENLVLAATAYDHKRKSKNGMLFRLNQKGAILETKTLKPGADNTLQSIRVLPDRGFIMTGQVQDDQGRAVGWLLRMDEDFNFRWQKQYPRGLSAELLSAVPYLQGYIAIAGRAKPLPGAGGLYSAWVMVVEDIDGDELWERYFRSSAMTEARDIIADKNGLLSVMINNKALKKKTNAEAEADEKAKSADDAEIISKNGETEEQTYESGDFVRLLSLNPRGLLLTSEDYFNAGGAVGNQLISARAGGERVIIGQTDALYQIEIKGQAEPDIIRSVNGWVLSAIPAESYVDPCIPK
ncbi:MAG: hypothetical protein L6Q57_00315 [Alphaproteobacteria bacterium]|nr:hypothetical protein [Alphaproteobacteria bacterium]